jgi:hypothetical protein
MRKRQEFRGGRFHDASLGSGEWQANRRVAANGIRQTRSGTRGITGSGRNQSFWAAQPTDTVVRPLRWEAGMNGSLVIELESGS